MPSNRKKLITKLDKMFSKKVRERDGKCLRCHRTENLQCAHVFSRSKKSTRWDLENAVTLCAGCHLYWAHVHSLDFYDWIKDRMGEKKFKALRQRSDFAVKFSEKDLEILITNLNQNV